MVSRTNSTMISMALRAARRHLRAALQITPHAPRDDDEHGSATIQSMNTCLETEKSMPKIGGRWKSGVLPVGDVADEVEPFLLALRRRDPPRPVPGRR